MKQGLRAPAASGVTACSPFGLSRQEASHRFAHRPTGATFIVKRWDVTVRGYGTGTYDASTRGKALADAWRCDAFSGFTFGEFLRRANCRRAMHPPRFGDPITVQGRPAFYLDRNSQYVRFAYPGKDVVLNSHPLDVLPEEYRPACYRTASADTRPKDEDPLGASLASGAVPEGQTPKGPRP